MSHDITISGGGVVTVESGELAGYRAKLLHLERELDAIDSRLGGIDRLLPMNELFTYGVPAFAVQAEDQLDDAAVALRWAKIGARELSFALAATALTYGFVERQVDQFSQRVAAGTGYALGWASPFLLLMFGGGALSLGAGLAAGVAVSPPKSRKALLDWFSKHHEALSDARMLQMLRLVVMSTDDFAGGVLKFSPGLMALLGDEGLGVLGVATSAGGLVGVANLGGVLAETPVEVKSASSKKLERSPRTFEDRVERIPKGAEQIRIDTIHVPGKPDRFEVYLGGTKDMSPMATGEPWDMTSNMSGMSLGDAGSYRAVREAMRQAGISETSPVQFTGYSQGALVAALLVSSGEYNTQGLLTVGGPVGQIDVPPEIPYVALEHSDDLVPVTGGTWAHNDAVVVTRNVYDGHSPNDVLVPAHELANYKETAVLLDQTADQRSTRVLEQLNRMGRGQESATTKLYLATRVTSTD